MTVIPDRSTVHISPSVSCTEGTSGETIATTPAGAAASCPTPVGWYGRVASDEQAGAMLTWQLDTVRRALPTEYTIVATFYDVGSGRLPPQERGSCGIDPHGLVALRRDGGFVGLLAEARQPGRRFHAVVCTSIDRIAVSTQLCAHIEHELAQAGIAVLTADEDFNRSAHPTLTHAADPVDR